MELDELKNTWDNQGKKEQQSNLTIKYIDQITAEKYNAKINKIAYPEMVGSCICLLSIINIGINFYKLDTAFLQSVGILSIVVLLALSIISFLSLRHLKIPDNFSRPYAETLKIFTTKKLEFFKLQKINMTLSYLLLVTIIILISKFFNNKDITGNKYFWIFSFTFGYLFLLFVTKIVTKSYKNTLTKTEELLQELKS